MSTVCGRPQGGGESGTRGRMWTGERGVKNVIFCGRHKWMAPMCFVQLIFSIIRHTFISKASNLVMSSFLIVLISAQYKVTLQISVFAILFLRHLHSSQSSPW